MLTSLSELAQCLDAEGIRINRDGPMWSLLLSFYLNEGTHNAAEISVIAGQAPQFGRPNPNWDQPLHGLPNIREQGYTFCIETLANWKRACK